MKVCRLLFLWTMLTVMARAHLCNDVFEQARDNLAVKVDIRDGQLRIHREASFRVHLLNTMDRDIVDIRLEVISPEFDADVTASPAWKSFPYLKTSRQGGKKEFYDVTLRRKSGIADGKYTIGLRLFNGQDRRMEFKTVAIADAMAVVSVPKAPAVMRIDGAPKRDEWSSAVLVTDFCKYVKAGRYMENARADCGTRVRMSADANYLYALMTAPAFANDDTLFFYFAADTDGQTRQVAVNLRDGAMQNAPEGAVAIPSADGVEIRLPLAGLQLGKSFLVNLARKRDGALSFWRGTGVAVDNPVVFGRLVLAN